MIAHLGRVPLEEILPAVTGAGGGLLLARGRLRLSRATPMVARDVS